MKFHFFRLLAVAGFAAAVAAYAASPTGGTLSVTTQQLTYNGDTFDAGNTSDPSGDGSNLRCAPAATFPCDDYALTVDLPADFATTNPGSKVRVEITWPNDGSDWDLYVKNSDAGYKGTSHARQTPASAQKETVEFAAGQGLQTFTVRAVPYAPVSSPYTATITLTGAAAPSTDADGDGVPDADDACPGTPAGTPVDASGCPVPQPDADHDGVPDSSDACPGTAEGATVDQTGCAVSLIGDPATCNVPGLTLMSDPGADNSKKVPGTDLKSLQLSQPLQNPVGDRIEDQLLAFRINVDAGAVPQPSSVWFVSFQTPSSSLQGVRMTGDSNGNPVFQSYFVGASSSGAQDGRFTDSTKPAHSNSTFDSASGAITIWVKATDLGFTAPGQQLKAFNVGVFTNGGGVVAFGADDGMPANDLSRSATVTYILHDNTICGGPPLKRVAPPPPASGLPPRYHVHASPEDLGSEAGEPSIGFNPFSKHTMFISYTQALRQTYAELGSLTDVAGNPLPESCDATWEDKSGTLTTVNSLDPILFTDQATGRTFNSQLSGDNSLMEYTDDDGETWTPAQQGPPNGGADHQAVATGVYPAGKVPPNALWPATGPKRAVYYCSQSVATAFCSRSDDGGQVFGPGFAFKNTECAAGALHGHVKVAPDGTVYVPDSSQCILPTGDSANHVIAFASEDAGQTWAVRTIPQSTGGNGSDPSIGIATDGTAYMCYPNADSTVHVAVSHDKGKTWTGGQDVGLAGGLVQTRFPQMIAGDPDRASCAFLGTTSAGNGDSLDFKGVWYGYQATTYDGGATWHLVNVTPNDPVQGYGGVGPDGTNRNLLDFNDLQIDEKGRTLFAFADGCIGGCVKDPSANSFAAKATIVRQTGGRTLFAEYDNKPLTQFNNPNPLKPAAACARQDLSHRSVVQADVVWNAPDTGGTPVTNYKVYRSLSASGPFSAIGDAGAQTSYVDATVKPSVEKYFYRVEAENALGVAPIGNIIELPITAGGADPCVIPGEIIAVDATGDAQGGDDMDIVFLGVAEPENYADSFVITYKIANFTAGTPPASSFYVILFPNFNNLYLALDSTSGPAAFVYGTFQEDPAGQGFLVYTKGGNLDARSQYAADGTIVMVVPRSLFGSPAAGTVIPGFDARARIGAQSANSRDTAGNVDYTVRGSASCADAGIAIADLTASVTEGKAPLEVDFTITGAQSKGKALSSYSILFGDEPGASPSPTTGSFAGQGSVHMSHSYQDVGTYRARLTVTDEAGGTSSNLAEETISVLPNQAPVAQAGIDQDVNEGEIFTLDGSGSTDPDGDSLAYTWTQRNEPAAVVTDPDPVAPSYRAPDVDVDTALLFRVTVRDSAGLEHFDEMIVTVHDVPGPTPPAPVTGQTQILGGSLPLLSLAFWGLGGALRLTRRRRSSREK